MFLNKMSLQKFSKTCKYSLENRRAALFSFSGVKAIPRVNHSKMTLFTLTENNGFQKGNFLNRNVGEIKTRRISEELGGGGVITKCWKCDHSLELKGFNCASCGALQHPQKNVNYFTLMGMPQMYDIDLEELTTKFRNLQMVFHPDKFANKSKVEQEISESYSTLLNKIHATLKDPVERGLYLLDLQKVSRDTGPIDQDFLVKVMEKNEELEGINSQTKLAQFLNVNNESIGKHIQIVTDAFRANKPEVARMNLLKLNYFMNLNARIREKQNSFSSTKGD